MNQKKWLLVGVALLLFAAIKVAALMWWQQKQPATASKKVQAACDVAQMGCPFFGDAVFRLVGVGSNKSPFAIEASHVPDSVQSISASFQMKDMDMGFNRFELRKQANGTWRVNGVYLPVCVAGRHDWQVKWQVNQQTFTADFRTQAD